MRYLEYVLDHSSAQFYARGFLSTSVSDLYDGASLHNRTVRRRSLSMQGLAVKLETPKYTPFRHDSRTIAPLADQNGTSVPHIQTPNKGFSTRPNRSGIGYLTHL